MSRKGIPNKRTESARKEIEALGFRPLESLVAVFERAIKAYDSGRGDTEKSDAGPAYLAVAARSASELASYMYPKLSAIAFKDMSDANAVKDPLTTEQAVKMLQGDPFAPQAIKDIPAERIVYAMKSNLERDLPLGNQIEDAKEESEK